MNKKNNNINDVNEKLWAQWPQLSLLAVSTDDILEDYNLPKKVKRKIKMYDNLIWISLDRLNNLFEELDKIYGDKKNQ